MTSRLRRLLFLLVMAGAQVGRCRADVDDELASFMLSRFHEMRDVVTPATIRSLLKAGLLFPVNGFDGGEKDMAMVKKQVQDRPAILNMLTEAAAKANDAAEKEEAAKGAAFAVKQGDVTTASTTTTTTTTTTAQGSGSDTATTTTTTTTTTTPSSLKQDPDKDVGTQDPSDPLQPFSPSAPVVQSVPLLMEIFNNDKFGVIEAVLKELVESDEIASEDVPAFIMKYFIAPITPVLNVSPRCYNQSLTYIRYLYNAPNYGVTNSFWALRMIDATGTDRSGLFSEITHFCTLMNYFVMPDFCKVAFAGRDLDFPIPVGNTYSLGSFDGCMNVKAKKNLTDPSRWRTFRGKHCVVRVMGKESAPLEKHIFSGETDLVGLDALYKSYSSPSFNRSILEDLTTSHSKEALFKLALFALQPTFGVCVPDGCSRQDVYNNYAALYDSLDAVGVPVSCETDHTQEHIQKLDSTAYAALGVLGGFAALVVLGTVADLYQLYFPREARWLKNFEGEDPLLMKCVKCFSARASLNTVLYEEHHSLDVDVRPLYGMISLSVMWFILGHTYLIIGQFPQKNPMKIADLYLGRTTMLGELVHSSSQSVDTFLFANGLLSSYAVFYALERGRFNIFVYWARRYVAWTVPTAFVVLFYAGIAKHLGRGPFWDVVDEVVDERCKDHWWVTALYGQNFYAQRRMCLSQSWYQALDMQMYFFAPLVLLPMYWLRHRHRGLAVWTVAMAAVTLVIVVLVNEYDLPPSLTTVYDSDDGDDFVVFRDFHIRPYVRAQPYLVGALTAYILWQMKGREFVIDWALNALAWAGSAATLFAVAFGLWEMRRDNTMADPSYSTFESAIYNGLARVAWSVSLAWMIFSASKGYGGALHSLLGCGVFRAAAHLNFVAYLVHYDLIAMFVFSAARTFEYREVTMIGHWVSFTTVSYLAAFVAVPIIDLPFRRLMDLLIETFLGPDFSPPDPALDDDPENFTDYGDVVVGRAKAGSLADDDEDEAKRPLIPADSMRPKGGGAEDEDVKKGK